MTKVPKTRPGKKFCPDNQDMVKRAMKRLVKNLKMTGKKVTCKYKEVRGQAAWKTQAEKK